MKRAYIFSFTMLLLSTLTVYAGFNDFSFSSFTLGGGQCVQQIPIETIAPTSYAFGNVSTGVTHKTSVNITNTGKGYLSGITFATGGSGKAAFRNTSSTCAGATLYQGQSCSYKVAFAPSVAGFASYSSHVDSDQFSRRSVLVSGTGVSSSSGYSYVGGAITNPGARANDPITYTGTSGNFLVVASGTAGSTFGATPISGGCASAWSAITTRLSASNTLVGMWTCDNANGTQITIANQSAGYSISSGVLEFAGGTKTTDVYASAAAPSGNKNVSVSATPTVDNDLLVVVSSSGQGPTYTGDATYTLPIKTTKLAMEYKILTGGAGQSQTGTFTLSSDSNWNAIIGAFK